MKYDAGRLRLNMAAVLTMNRSIKGQHCSLTTNPFCDGIPGLTTTF